MAQLHNLTRNMVLIGAALSLSACSTLSSFAGSVWSGTESVATKASSSVASLFRSGPKHDTGQAFLSATGDEMLNTAKLAERVATQPSGYYARQRGSNGQPPVIYRSDAERVSGATAQQPQLRGRYQGYQSYERGASFAAPARPINTQSIIHEPSAPDLNINTDSYSGTDSDAGALSYVKIGGGSSMAEWQSCEVKAGGYFLQNARGFTVMPAFDSCMRSKGYITEAEAEAKFAQLETRRSFAP